MTDCSLNRETRFRNTIYIRYQGYYRSDTATINVPIAGMAGKAERDEKSSRKEEGRDSSYRSRIDLWTLPRHQEAKSVSSVSFLFPFAGQRLVSFFLHPVCLPESTVSSLSMQPRCGRSCHCSGDRYPSSRLRAKVTTLYLESQLMPPPLSRDHPLIIDEPPSTPVLTQLLRNLSLPLLSPLLPPSTHSPSLRESA